MSHLALIPLLETHVLPGWPQVYEPGLVDWLTVLLGIPAAIAAVVALVTMGPAWYHRSRGTGQAVERA